MNSCCKQGMYPMGMGKRTNLHCMCLLLLKFFISTDQSIYLFPSQNRLRNTGKVRKCMMVEMQQKEEPVACMI